MRKISLILIIAVLAASLIACGDDPVAPTGFAGGQTVEAYNYVHGGYVGRAVVQTAEDGSLQAELDEAFLPHTLAQVDIEAPEWNEDNTVYYLSRGNQVRTAKYISYNGTNYVGTTVGGAVIYVAADDEGNPSGGQDLELIIIRSEANMKTYWDSIAQGGFQVYTEFGGQGQAVTTTASGSLYKRGSSYWNFGDLGWQGNIDAVEEAAARFGTGFTLDEMVRGSDNKWLLADAVTGATLSDFKDYFGLIQMAVGRLKME
ncbi:hypothetical protein [Spirochaeta dissipatitropha]